MLLPSGHIFLKFFGVGALELFRADSIAEQNVVVVHEDVGQLLYQQAYLYASKQLAMQKEREMEDAL